PAADNRARPVAVEGSSRADCSQPRRHWQTLLTQLLPVAQAGQLSTSPQPSERMPHWPAAHAVRGVQLAFLVQTLATQVRLPLQPPPQATMLLQPSGILPQSLPCAAHVVGVQPQAL